MPKQYVAVRDSLMKEGMDKKEARRRAAMIYIARGKGGSRHSRAKALAKDR